MSEPQTKRLKVLIVEDHELARNGLVFSLNKKSGFQVVGEAENGEQALRICEDQQPDVVLMDIGMPVMDGIEATQQIKRTWPRIKVMMLTSHQDGEEIFASLAAGADAYCLKDIKIERLIQIMEMVDEGALWLDPSIARHVMNSLVIGIPDKAKSYQNRNRYNAELTERELEVLQLIVNGKTNKEIGDQLKITVHTVKAHVGSIIQKLSVDDRTQAAVKALRDGIVAGKTL